MIEVLLTERDSLDRISDIWSDLWARTQPRAPMLELSWIRQWWRQHQREGELHLLLVLDEKHEPLGLAPLYLRQDRVGPRRFLRTLTLLGTGEREEDEVLGEYNTWLAAPGAMAHVSAQLAAHLLAPNTAGWDLVRLEKLRPEAGIHDALPCSMAHGIAATSTITHASFRLPVMPLERYLAALPSSSFRHRCRRALRAGSEAGVEWVRAKGADQIAEMFTELRSLHQRRWNGRGHRGAFASDVFSCFHASLVEDCARDGRIWLVGLRKGQQWLAVRYLLRAGDTLYDYLSGVDTETETALAPGLLLHLWTLDRAAEAGVQTYDLMAGDQEYKRKLALAETPLPTLELYARTIRARVWLALRELRRDLALVRGTADMSPDHVMPPLPTPPKPPEDTREDDRHAA